MNLSQTYFINRLLKWTPKHWDCCLVNPEGYTQNIISDSLLPLACPNDLLSVLT